MADNGPATEALAIIDANVARYRHLLQTPLDADARQRVSSLLSEAEATRTRTLKVARLRREAAEYLQRARATFDLPEKKALAVRALERAQRAESLTREPVHDPE